MQLRRYRMEPGRLPDFLAWFPALVPTREQYGFRLRFALADHEHEHEHETFTWAVEHEGDAAAFAQAEQACHSSPQRAEVFETFPGGIAEMEIGLAEDVPRR